MNLKMAAALAEHRQETHDLPDAAECMLCEKSVPHTSDEHTVCVLTARRSRNEIESMIRDTLLDLRTADPRSPQGVYLHVRLIVLRDVASRIGAIAHVAQSR